MVRIRHNVTTLIPTFAEDPRDAQDAVRGRDGYDFYGTRIRVRTVACHVCYPHWRCCVS